MMLVIIRIVSIVISMKWIVVRVVMLLGSRLVLGVEVVELFWVMGVILVVGFFFCEG